MGDEDNDDGKDVDDGGKDVDDDGKDVDGDDDDGFSKLFSISIKILHTFPGERRKSD